jgi:hypothetical protein
MPDTSVSGLDLVVGHPSKRVVAQVSRDEPFRERSERRALAGGETSFTQHVWIRCQQLGRRRQAAAEALLDVGDDRAGRADGQLLGDDLHDQSPEGVDTRKVVEPAPRPEVRACVDHPRKDRVRLPEEVARCGIGDRGHRHAHTRRPVSIAASAALCGANAWSPTRSRTGGLATGHADWRVPSVIQSRLRSKRPT